MDKKGLIELLLRKVNYALDGLYSIIGEITPHKDSMGVEKELRDAIDSLSKAYSQLSKAKVKLTIGSSLADYELLSLPADFHDTLLLVEKEEVKNLLTYVEGRTNTETKGVNKVRSLKPHESRSKKQKATSIMSDDEVEELPDSHFLSYPDWKKENI